METKVCHCIQPTKTFETRTSIKGLRVIWCDKCCRVLKGKWQNKQSEQPVKKELLEKELLQFHSITIPESLSEPLRIVMRRRVKQTILTMRKLKSNHPKFNQRIELLIELDKKFLNTLIERQENGSQRNGRHN